MDLEWLLPVMGIFFTCIAIIVAFIHKTKSSHENKKSKDEILDKIKDLEKKISNEESNIKSNLRTFQLNDFQKAELGMSLLPIEKELSLQREKDGKRLKSHSKKGKSRDIVAKKVGLSGTTFERAKKIIEVAPEDVKQRLREGKTSISYEYSIIKE